MTEDEELEMLRLRKQKALAAQASQPAATPAAVQSRPIPGPLQTFVATHLQDATMGLGDRLSGEAQGMMETARAAFDPAVHILGPDSVARRSMDAEKQARLEAGQDRELGAAANPWAAGAAHVTGQIFNPVNLATFGTGLLASGGEALLSRLPWLASKLGPKVGPFLANRAIQSLAGGGLSAANTAAQSLAETGNVGESLSRGAQAIPMGLAGGASPIGTGGYMAAKGLLSSGPNERANDTLGGLTMMLGGAAHAASKVPAAVGASMRGGYVQPTPEALRLTQQGAKLTLGQMSPSSMFGHTEELAAKTVTGGPLTSAREAGAASVRDAMLKAAAPPGVDPPTKGAPVGQQIEELRAGFTKLYDNALEGVKLNPDKYMGSGKWRGLLTDEAMRGSAKTKGAFELAAQAKDIDASPAVRRRALSWLSNEAESLNPTKSGPNAGTVDAKSIQALRTRLRDKVANLGEQGDDRQLREIYQRAEEHVSELLDAQLPPERAQMLRDADAHYRNLSAVKEAAKRAFVQDEKFTPDQLLQAIRSKGATSGLESVARDAHAVLNPKYTPTGLQGAAVANIPGYKVLGPAWASLANSSPALRAHALQTSAAQASLAPPTSIARLVQPSAFAANLFSRPPFRPAMAADNMTPDDQTLAQLSRPY